MADLEAQLQEAQAAARLAHDRHRRRLLHGRRHRASSTEICDLADKYDAMVMVDDSHATGFVGKTGRGTPEHCGVLGRVDIITGHARQGARRRGRRLHQRAQRRSSSCCGTRSRPYLFCNTLPPPIVGAALEVLDLLTREHRAARPAGGNTQHFRERHDARRASRSARAPPDRADHARRRGARRRAARRRCSTKGST